MIRLLQKKQNRILDRRYSFKHIGISGVLLQELSIRIVPLFPKWFTANTITFLGFISSIMVLYFLSIFSGIAGLFILITLWLDLADGYTARNLDQSSKSGHLFDAMVDLSLYLCVITALYLHGYKNIPFLIMTLYAIDVYLRLQLGHSTLILAPKVDSFKSTTPLIAGAIKNIKLVINPLLNHTDAMTFLAVLIIIDISLVRYWLFYDLIRRFLTVITKLPEIYHIYKNDKIYLH